MFLPFGNHMFVFYVCESVSVLHIHSFVFFFFFKFYLFIYLFGCVGSSLLCEGFLQPQRAGATLHRGARASHRRGPPRWGAQAPDAQAQQSWLTGPVAPRHVGSSQTRARTRVPCTSRQTLNHCATREAHLYYFLDCTDEWYHIAFVFLWLTSLGMIIPRSIHVAANGIISFFFMAG